MNIPGVIEELKKKYPGKKIFLNNRQNCTEILCETEPASTHPSYSEVISVIDKTDLHFHDVTRETYKIIRGVLSLMVDGRKLVLNEGQSFTVEPGEKHEAIGNETWVLCISQPGWKKNDHKLVTFNSK